MHIGMLTDYVAVDMTNGPALASQTFRRNMEMRGHQCTLIGPRPGDNQREAPPGSVLLNSGKLRAYDGVRIAFPSPAEAIYDIPKFDVVHAHSNTLMMHWAPMIRDLHGIPALSTNTVYLPGFVHTVIPDGMLKFGPTARPLDELTKYVERSFASVYNAGDGLIVQCQGLIDYWRSVGMIDVPIHVISRPIDVRNFNRPLAADPFRPDFRRGGRVIVVCRHAKEKALDKLLNVFAHYILPQKPEASLTLIGDGPHHTALQTAATRLGIIHRTDFVGERPQRDLPNFYGHADVFLYTSMIETFGQVVSEALWMGLPVVGKDDGMGVAHQVKHDVNGLLVTPGDNEEELLGAAVRELFDDENRRREFGRKAAERQRTVSAPEVVYAQYEAAYASAQEHYAKNPSPHAGRRDLATKWRMMRKHVYPWTWKHIGLLTLGSMSNDYKARSEVPFDAAPDNPADEKYAHDGGRSPVPQRHVASEAATPTGPTRKKRASTTTKRAPAKKRATKA